MNIALDPVTLEVLSRRLEVIAQEMGVALIRSAYSSIVKEGHDASAALFDRNGEMIAQATALPAQLGILTPAVQRVISQFPLHGMHQGDVFILNDPYDGGSHLPDIAVIAPVMSGNRPVAIAATIAHHQDVGGKTPGSIPTDATDIFQEGLRIPVMRLMDAGKRVQPVWEIIERNVRVPEVVLGDLSAQLAALHVGQRRLMEVFDEYGESVHDYLTEMLRHAEVLTRSRLENIPDGHYKFTDYLDSDGIDVERAVPITATVSISGSNINVDFSGSSDQVKGPVNADRSAVMSSVYFVLRSIAGGESIPNNGGCYRPLTVSLPAGSVVNPSFPAPVNGRTITMKRICDVLLGALVEALPAQIPAAPSGLTRVLVFGGTRPASDSRFVCADLGTGGTGGWLGGDGVDSLETDIANTMNMPAETQEADYPLRVVKSRLWRDSAGPGKWRGGLGVEREIEVTADEVLVTIREDRHRTRAWGLFGGKAAELCRAEIVYQNGRKETIPSKGTFLLNTGDRIHCWGAGGAGYGDPLERPAGDVLRDVLDQKVSAEAARLDYGVVMSDSFELDDKETRNTRKQARALRGELSWTFDRGEMGRK